MEIEVPGSESDAVLRRDGDLVGQRTRVVAEDLQRPRILAGRRRRFVAPCDDDHRAVRGQHSNLMRVDTRINRCALRRLATDASVRVDRVDGHAAWIVVRHEHVPAGAIAGDVDGASAQPRGRTVLAQGAVGAMRKTVMPCRSPTGSTPEPAYWRRRCSRQRRANEWTATPRLPGRSLEASGTIAEPASPVPRRRQT